MELRIAGGPSPFGEPGVCLLQVGVQAGDAPAPKRRPAHLVAVVDTSSSMRQAGRLGVVRRALSAMAEALGADDRMSIVACGADAEILIEDAGREHLADLRAAIASLRPGGGSWVAEGLRLAHSLVSGGAARPVRIAVFSDGMSAFTPATRTRIHAMLAGDARHGARLSVVDMGAADAAHRQPLQELAKLAGGVYFSARTFDEARAALWQMITDRSQVVAENAKLTLAFNPEVVEAFRLIGHEPGGAGLLFDDGADGHSATAMFHAQQACTALFEVKLRPAAGPGYPNATDAHERIATARLTWSTPEGRSRRTVRRINQAPFARSFEESAMPLQLAALVAETAEILVQSPYARGNSLSQVLEQAKRANYQLRDRRSFVEFIEFVKAAARR